MSRKLSEAECEGIAEFEEISFLSLDEITFI